MDTLFFYKSSLPMKKLIIVSVLLLVIVIGVGFYFLYPSLTRSKKPTDIRTFEDCQAAGFLVVETKPRECHTKHNQVFIEVYNGELVKDVIQVTEPKANQAVTSPFKLEGKAVGGWYFDEILNARLEDDNGKVIVRKEIKALSSTKTNGFVSFVAAITYKTDDLSTSSGKLIIEKTNTTFKGNGTPLVIPLKLD